MVFNSIEFLYFFAVVLFVYFALPPQKPRNLFLLGASYFFYMWWRPDYAILMLITTSIGYLTARGMDWTEREREQIAHQFANFFADYQFRNPVRF